MDIDRLKSAVSLASLLLLAAPAFAQYSPDASVDLGAGYGATALGSATLDGTRRLGQDGKKSSAPAARPSQARMNELMARLKPEYEERLRRDGKPSADQWLKEAAFELGRQDGQAARAARQGR